MIVVHLLSSSIIIILLIILFIFLYRKGSMWFSQGKAKWVLGGYVIILLVSVGVYQFIKPTPVTVEKELEEEEYPYLYDLAYGGEITSIDPQFKQSHWDFPLNGDKIQLQTEAVDTDEIPIFIEKVNDDVQEIEVTYYQTPTIFDGLNVSSYLPAPIVHFSKNTLEISNRTKVELSFSNYESEFPFTQFISSRGGVWDDSSYVSFGETLIYIRIPKTVKLQGGQQAGIEYVK